MSTEINLDALGMQAVWSTQERDAVLQRLREAEREVERLEATVQEFGERGLAGSARIALLERVRAAAKELCEVAGRIALVSFASGALSVAGKSFYARRDQLITALAEVDDSGA